MKAAHRFIEWVGRSSLLSDILKKKDGLTVSYKLIYRHVADLTRMQGQRTSPMAPPKLERES